MISCLLLALALTSASPIWRDCESSKPLPFVAHDVSVNPWPPVVGNSFSLRLRDGSMQKNAVVLSYLGVPLVEDADKLQTTLSIPTELPTDAECDLTVKISLESGATICGITSFKPTRMVLSDAIIAQVNSDQKIGWIAGRNEYFENMDIETAKKMMGAKPDVQKLPAKTFRTFFTLPTSFDSRSAWPNCTGPVLDQGRCGSCWAFGAAEAMSDRMCISGGNSTFIQLAALDLTVNDMGNSGCQGGMPGSAWMWGKTKGLVSEACLPYGKWESPPGPIPTCPAAMEPCMPNTFVNTPAPDTKCDNGATYQSDKHKLKTVYALSSVTDIMTDLVQSGPVEAAFNVYEDFVHYKSGVYKHTSGGLLGGHAVAIIGYGSLNGEQYWLVQNSWTTTWGEDGYFMIAKGVDECGIEDGVVAGTY